MPLGNYNYNYIYIKKGQNNNASKYKTDKKNLTFKIRT